ATPRVTSRPWTSSTRLSVSTQICVPSRVSSRLSWRFESNRTIGRHTPSKRGRCFRWQRKHPSSRRWLFNRTRTSSVTTSPPGLEFEFKEFLDEISAFEELSKGYL